MKSSNFIIYASISFIIILYLTEKTDIKRAVIVVTESRLVVFGYTEDTSGESINLTEAYIIQGQEPVKLATEGPFTMGSISSQMDIEVKRVTEVYEVTKVAKEKWENVHSS